MTQTFLTIKWQKQEIAMLVQMEAQLDIIIRLRAKKFSPKLTSLKIARKFLWANPLLEPIQATKAHSKIWTKTNMILVFILAVKIKMKIRNICRLMRHLERSSMKQQLPQYKIHLRSLSLYMMNCWRISFSSYTRFRSKK